MEYLYIICIGLLVFFSFSLLTKRNKPLSEHIFSYWIILLLVTELSFFVHVKGLSGSYPLFITLICDSHLLQGVILYLYVRAFTDPGFRLRPAHLWHLLPMTFQIVAKLLLNFVYGEMDCYNEGGCVDEDNIYVTLTYVYKYLVIGTYIAFTWAVVIRYRKNSLSPRDVMRANWVKQITQGVVFLFFGVLVLQLGRILMPNLFWERMLLGNTLATLFIFIFLYIGNSYTYLFVMPSKNRFKNLSESFNPNNCKQAAVKTEMEDLFANLSGFMEKEKPFVKPQLTIKELSELSGIPAASLSQAINSITGKSVTDYINTYRVNGLKEKLDDPRNKNYKIMVLAEECGFVSKTTLIRIFRQQTGMTPGEYQNRIRKGTPDSAS